MKRLDISDSTAISMPMKNLLAIIAAVCVGGWAYFGVLERLTSLETKAELAEKDLNQAITLLEQDLTKNTEFRIKWPRGELGQSQSDLEQYMMIEELYKNIDKMQQHLDSMADNKINIEFLQEQMEKAQQNIDKLKDADREIVYKNGNGN